MALADMTTTKTDEARYMVLKYESALQENPTWASISSNGQVINQVHIVESALGEYSFRVACKLKISTEMSEELCKWTSTFHLLHYIERQ